MKKTKTIYRAFSAILFILVIPEYYCQPVLPGIIGKTPHKTADTKAAATDAFLTTSREALEFVKTTNSVTFKITNGDNLHYATDKNGVSMSLYELDFLGDGKMEYVLIASKGNGIFDIYVYRIIQGISKLLATIVLEKNIQVSNNTLIGEIFGTKKGLYFDQTNVFELVPHVPGLKN